jgi:hypothetical protein
MINKVSSNILLFVCVLLSTVLLVEVVLNLMVKPSEDSSGLFRNIQLPPMNVLPPNLDVRAETQRTAFEGKWFKSLIVNGKKITGGDLWGIFKEDPLIGYIPKENAVSTNGWWQSNNLGARARQDIIRGKLTDKRRLLFFGDSFTQGSRVPQEETFQHYINTKSSAIEAVNFGVDGYSMGQAYLRYTTLKDKLEYDHVFLVLAPSDDLWRDINVSREIGENWDSYMIYPRFVIEKNRLKLVASPYRNLQELADDNREYIKARLRQHLEKYEAFYFDSGYQSKPLLDWSVMYRLYRAYRLKKDRSRLLSSLNKPESEALQVTKKIVEAMDGEVRERGSRYSLVFLPDAGLVWRYSHEDDFKESWKEMVSYICARQINCIDLMGYFQRVPFENLDSGYDDTHYGAVSNSLIADFILESDRLPAASR